MSTFVAVTYESILAVTKKNKNKNKKDYMLMIFIASISHMHNIFPFYDIFDGKKQIAIEVENI